MNTKLTILAASILCAYSGLSAADIIVGTDLNSTQGANSTINQIYSGNRGSNGGGDQSLQFGDQLHGTEYADVIIGGLGIDVLFGYEGDDVLLGGTEDFNPLNRDRAFGQQGDDIFIWAPGDGNDFFDGGEGTDVLIMTLVGESRDDNGNSDGAPFFSVNPPNKIGSQDFDGIYINPTTYLPVVDVLSGPGFCDVLDQASAGLNELNLDHLVRFTLRGPANAFDTALAADPNLDPDSLDTGLRIAVHLKNTEFVVCGSRDGNEIDVFDLRQSPVEKVTINELPATAYQLVTEL
jgi:hypothetical protein